MAIISDEKIREYFNIKISPVKPYEDTLEYKKENIAAFNGLDRAGLEYGSREKRLLLYVTKLNEKSSKYN